MFPEYHRFFSDVFGKTSVTVLMRWPDSRPLVRARVGSIEKALREASGGRFGREKAERLKASAKPSVGQDSPQLGFQLCQLHDAETKSPLQLSNTQAQCSSGARTR